MPFTSVSPSQRIARFPGRIESLQHLHEIAPEHITSMSRTELYAVIAEHWGKCTDETRFELLQHRDAFVRRLASDIDDAVGGSPRLVLLAKAD